MAGRRAMVALLATLALSSCRQPQDQVARPAPPTTTALAAPGACLPATGNVPVRPDGSVPALTAIQPVGRQEAWAVGSHLIVHTADGGATWQRQYVGPADLASVDFVDARHGWAASLSGPLLATDDGGRCWTERAKVSPRLRAVHFVDPDVGWGVTSDSDPYYGSLPATGGRLVRSDDGGRTWVGQPAPDDVQSVCLTDRSDGWMTASGALYRTVDGGHHWEPVPLPGRQPSVSEVQCAPGTAWVVGTGGAGLGHMGHALYRVAADGPATAVLAESYIRTVEAPPTEGTAPGGFSSIGQTAAVLVGYTSAFEAGRTTRLAVVAASGSDVRRPGTPVPEVTRPTGVGFTSERAGWLVGVPPTPTGGPTSAVIARTDDGGSSWTIQFRTG